MYIYKPTLIYTAGAQQLVIQREQAMLEAAVKDGVTATTATAAMVALNPAAAAKVIFNACVAVYG